MRVPSAGQSRLWEDPAAVQMSRLAVLVQRPSLLVMFQVVCLPAFLAASQVAVIVRWYSLKEWSREESQRSRWLRVPQQYWPLWVYSHRQWPLQRGQSERLDVQLAEFRVGTL
jgi:hypothetical protein